MNKAEFLIFTIIYGTFIVRAYYSNDRANFFLLTIEKTFTYHPKDSSFLISLAKIIISPPKYTLSPDMIEIIVQLSQLVVMRATNTLRKGKQQLAITAELIDVLREVNLNASWKNGSTKFSKTRTGCVRNQTKTNNLMTEQDLDRLFSKSKEKSKMKTEIVILDDRPRSPLTRDFTGIKFLQLQDEYDRMLTGLPFAQIRKENSPVPLGDCPDLTVKFKREYVVGKVIGEGAYASVRVAIFRPENRKIAIKAYEKVKIRDPQRKRTVRRQIKILQMVNHPNIVRIHDVVETNNHVNIVMQYLPGISLGTSLKQQPGHHFSQQDCKRIVRQLAGALKYLHQMNIAHRDIKLENVILDENLSPKLIDFGFSTCIQHGKKMKIYCGTPSYMAPQIIQKKEYRGQMADIWALGVLMFVMLTGYFPYKGSTDEELYQKINLADYPKNEVLLKKPAHLLSRMFIIHPQERITAEEIVNHPWLHESVSPRLDSHRRPRNENTSQIKKLVNSKEKSPRLKQEDKSKSIKPADKERGLMKPSGKIAQAATRPRFQRTLANPLLQDASSLSKNKGQKRTNQQKVRMVQLLRAQLRRRSEEKTKCKSHRA